MFLSQWLAIIPFRQCADCRTCSTSLLRSNYFKRLAHRRAVLFVFCMCIDFKTIRHLKWRELTSPARCTTMQLKYTDYAIHRLLIN